MLWKGDYGLEEGILGIYFQTEYELDWWRWLGVGTSRFKTRLSTSFKVGGNTGGSIWTKADWAVLDHSSYHRHTPAPILTIWGGGAAGAGGQKWPMGGEVAGYASCPGCMPSPFLTVTGV
jgi:hypothetical protein